MFAWKSRGKKAWFFFLFLLTVCIDILLKCQKEKKKKMEDSFVSSNFTEKNLLLICTIRMNDEENRDIQGIVIPWNTTYYHFCNFSCFWLSYQRAMASDGIDVWDRHPISHWYGWCDFFRSKHGTFFYIKPSVANTFSLTRCTNLMFSW